MFFFSLRCINPILALTTFLFLFFIDGSLMSKVFFSYYHAPLTLDHDPLTLDIVFKVQFYFSSRGGSVHCYFRMINLMLSLHQPLKISYLLMIIIQSFTQHYVNHLKLFQARKLYLSQYTVVSKAKLNQLLTKIQHIKIRNAFNPELDLLSTNFPFSLYTSESSSDTGKMTSFLHNLDFPTLNPLICFPKLVCFQ